ncbi:hypothetical protein JNO12_17285 [Erwinia aphidicola]|nr:hypothetical protein [Erwinia aphidicola]
MQKSARKTGMPLLIPSAEFDEKLSRTSTGKNTQHTQAFIDGGSHDFYLPDYAVPPGYRLLQSSREDQYRLIKAGAEPETVYAVKLLLLDTIVPSRRSCTQIMVWRSVLPQHEKAQWERSCDLTTFDFAPRSQTVCYVHFSHQNGCRNPENS